MELIVIYLAAGLAAGLVSGLFGLGGGLTIVPALAFALPLEGVNQKYVMHLAVGTSLVVMVVTALYTTVLRHRRGDLDWALFRGLAPRVVLGAVLGAICGDLLPGVALRVFFIGFVSATIARALQRRYGTARGPGDSETSQAPATMPRNASLWFYGIATGVCGALLGAGAAIIIVPYLRAAGYRIQLASAIAAGLSAAIGVGAGAGYVAGGLNEIGLPSAAIGYLYLPAFAGLSIGALVGSPLGVKISHKLDEDIQFWLFLGYLAIVLGVMILRR
ncbi:MAG: sulfite exporter TauE/SafE family protein [Deltaproteobacteria bacterium]|nr:sulfite exporter TauE/SafE family protein [Deltaproteobacteria bacterium]MDZ4342548.1 sulfite exporter TauE/SafE family protein [Candidatus Binatia bacterium]